MDALLNEPQAQAVGHVRGPLLVFAGAGSGKTRVITYRVANLVLREHVPPYRILAVTFTNKAAGEMRERLAKLLGDEGAMDLWVGTFHATCAKLLRRHGGPVGVEQNFTIYDSQDQKAVVSRVLKELDLDEKRFAPRALLSKILSQKQEGRGPDEMSVDTYFDEITQRVFEGYEKHLAASNAVDFEDLIAKTVKLLDTSSPEAEALQRRFEYVLVDEFQDTNASQYALVRSLTRRTNNLCVVGDDDQSIYRWRGADVRNIRGFKRDFPSAAVIKLEQNYRSSARIVAAALAVIEPSLEREPKALFTEKPEGEPIEVVGVSDERREAAFVASRLQERTERGLALSDVAVFYRVHAQSRVLEEALRAAGLPYRIVGGTKFFERAEVKDALAYLRLIANPRSDVDLTRIVNVPSRGIGKTTVDRLIAWASDAGVSLQEALGRLPEVDSLRPAAKKKLIAFRTLIDEARARSEELRPSELLEHVLDASGYRQQLESDPSFEAEARLENIGELVGAVRDFETEAEAAGEPVTLDAYLERVSLHADGDDDANADAVTLMTVHGAKGLEFDEVIVTGMEEEMFPYRSAREGESDDALEEERRLAYVAITRARERLTLTHAGTRQIFGQTRFGRPSRFLYDLPEETLAEPVGGLAASSGSRSTSEFAFRSSWGSQSERSSPRAHESSDSTYVDRSFFDDTSGEHDAEATLRRGSRVWHARFGEGEVRRVTADGEPAAVAFFPGWGEKKVLLRFLRPA